MRGVLLDADAFRCLRELSLLRPCLTQVARVTVVHLTERVARHELSLVQKDVVGLEDEGLLTVEKVTTNTPAGDRYRAFTRAGHDKGESESVAWALDAAPGSRAVFVTRDAGAGRLAEAQRVPTSDVFGLLVAAIELAGLDRERARNELTVWTGAYGGRCCPKDWKGFEATYAARRGLARERSGA